MAWRPAPVVAAYSVSELGSAVGAGALPLIAVLVLDVSAWQMSMLAVAAGIAGTAVAVPLWFCP